MNYNARFTVLIKGATWGVENVELEDVETKEEAFEMALQKEQELSHGKKQLLLDYITDSDGNMYEVE